MSEESSEVRNISKRQLFHIFLKTGRRRVTLSIISGTIIFLVLTGLVMIVYTHRFQAFQAYQEEKVDWYNDGFLSVSCLHDQTSTMTISSNYIGNVTQDFVNLASGLIPNVKLTNYTTAISAQFHSFEVELPESLSQEIITFEDNVYNVLSNCLVEGRLPTEKHELLWYNNNVTGLALNDTIELRGNSQRNSPSYNYTIVGIINQVRPAFRQSNISTDILDWTDILDFANYRGNNRFFTSLTLYQELINNLTSYNGIMTYLLDAKYDLTELKLNGLTNYIKLFPTETYPAESEFLGDEVLLCPDLKVFIADFSSYWILATSQILTINAPLFFIIGLVSVVTLNIGSKELGSTFRRMKIYGLSYRNIRSMVLLENFIFTIVSFIGGTLFGFLLSYVLTINIDDRPHNYYLNFVTEPLLFIVIIASVLGFFSLSFFIQNSIAKKTAKTTIEEYAQKRRPILTLFSTNEFRMLVLSLIFVMLSVGLYLLYYFSKSTTNVATGINYLTFFYFMLSCSATVVMSFIFLAIARLTTLFWTFISNQTWIKRLNMYTLSIRHLSVSKSSYQIAILGALIFGLVILPGFTMPLSIRENTSNKAFMAMGTSNLAIMRWVDPDNERDGIFTNISEISYFTEVTVYEITEENLEFNYPKAFNAYVLALESPENFTLVANRKVLNQSCPLEDIQGLENDWSILMNKKYAKANHLYPGDLFDTSDIARFPTNLTFVNSYDNFPLLPIPTKPLFAFQMDAFSMVGNKYTITQFIGDLDFSTDIKVQNIKLIKAVNESSIPIIQTKLQQQNIKAISFSELFDQMNLNIDVFSQNNLLFYAVLSILTLFFVGYFTGLRIFEERGKIIESLYRVGAIRGQILRFFTLEYILINLLPMTIMILLTLPLLRFVAKYFLGYNEYYSPYKPNVPGWIILVVILGGLLVTTIGWLFALIPSIYKYRLVKQE
ncbi:MAG TPA: FtsX-like permease family protein [Candidatus Bathyarchaeia archaeon]|nr:FtsX-like permease family protein [Candidatus Bathyarchaeia archaeon]